LIKNNTQISRDYLYWKQIMTYYNKGINLSPVLKMSWTNICIIFLRNKQDIHKTVVNRGS